jgi:hypothetical protein
VNHYIPVEQMGYGWGIELLNEDQVLVAGHWKGLEIDFGGDPLVNPHPNVFQGFLVAFGQ